MSWTYKSKKDGTTLEVPDNVELGSKEFLDLLAKARAGNATKALTSPTNVQGEATITQNSQSQSTPTNSPVSTLEPGLAGFQGMAKGISGMVEGTTPGGMAGAVARGNPLTATMGAVGDVANSIVQGVGGKPIILNPNDPNAAGKDPSQQIQDYLTSLGVPNAESEAEKFTQFLSGFIPMGGPSKVATGQQTAAEQAVLDAKAVGGKLMTSDVFPPKGPAGQLMQTVMEKNPFLGTGSLRVAQQKDRIEAVRGLLSEYGANDLNQTTDAVMTDLLQKRGEDLAKLTTQKNEVIERLSKPIQQPNIVDMTGAPSSVVPSVPVENTITAIDTQIAKLKSLNTNEVAPVIAKLEDWKKAIQNQPLENIELLRRQFGNSFNDPGLAGVKDTAQKSLNEIYPAVNKDMGDFIKSNGKPEDYAQWKSANEELSGKIKELEVVALKNALDNGGQTPEVVQRLLFSSKPSDTQLLYKNLSPEGRASAQAAVLSKVAQNALTSGTEIVSPEKFVTQVQKMGGPIGVLFSGEDKARLEGLVRYLNATRQASKFTANPQTGIQNMVPILGISSTGGLAGVFGGGAPTIESALAGIAGTVAGGSIAGAASRLYESPMVRDLFVKLSRAKEKDNTTTLINRISMAIMAGKENVDGNKGSK